MNAMWKLDVKGNMHIIQCKEDFVQLVQDYMGKDAAQWLTDFIQEGVDFQNNLLIKDIFQDMRDDIVKQMDATMKTIQEELNDAKKNNLSEMWA